MKFPFEIIPPVITAAVEVTKAIIEAKTGHKIDATAWKAMGTEITGLVQKALAGDDITHEDVMKYIPETLKLELLQLQKKAKRLAAGLPVVGS